MLFKYLALLFFCVCAVNTMYWPRAVENPVAGEALNRVGRSIVAPSKKRCPTNYILFFGKCVHCTEYLQGLRCVLEKKKTPKMCCRHQCSAYNSPKCNKWN